MASNEEDDTTPLKLISLPTEILLRIVEREEITVEDLKRLRFVHSRFRSVIPYRIFRTCCVVIATCEQKEFCKVPVQQPRPPQVRFKDLCIYPSFAWVRSQFTELKITILRRFGRGGDDENNKELIEFSRVAREQITTTELFPQLRQINWSCKIIDSGCSLTPELGSAFNEFHEVLRNIFNLYNNSGSRLRISANLDYYDCYPGGIMLHSISGSPVHSLKLRNRLRGGGGSAPRDMSYLLRTRPELEELDISGFGLVDFDQIFGDLPLKLHRIALTGGTYFNKPSSVTWLSNLRELEVYHMDSTLFSFPWEAAMSVRMQLEAIKLDWVHDQFPEYLSRIERNKLRTLIIRLPSLYFDHNSRGVAQQLWDALRNHQESLEDLSISLQPMKDRERRLGNLALHDDPRFPWSICGSEFHAAALKFPRIKTLSFSCFYNTKSLSITGRFPKAELTSLLEASDSFKRLTLDVQLFSPELIGPEQVRGHILSLTRHAIAAGEQWRGRTYDHNGRSVAEAYWIILRTPRLLPNGYRLHVVAKGDN